MPRAVWNNMVIADSDSTKVVEGNHYFPPEAIRRQFLRESDTQTHCPWKGDASYYHIEVSGQMLRDAAWYYPQTKPEAREIEGYVAFWKGVQVDG